MIAARTQSFENCAIATENIFILLITLKILFILVILPLKNPYVSHVCS